MRHYAPLLVIVSLMLASAGGVFYMWQHEHNSMEIAVYGLLLVVLAAVAVPLFVHFAPAIGEQQHRLAVHLKKHSRAVHWAVLLTLFVAFVIERDHIGMADAGFLILALVVELIP